MNLRIAASVASLSTALVLVGCEKNTDAAGGGAPAAQASPTPAAQAATAEAPTPAERAAAPAKDDDAPAKSVTRTADAGVVVQGNGKTVAAKTGAEGTDVKLENKSGTGSVNTASGGVSITGKSGKTLAIPTAPR